MPLNWGPNSWINTLLVNNNTSRSSSNFNSTLGFIFNSTITEMVPKVNIDLKVNGCQPSRSSVLRTSLSSQEIFTGGCQQIYFGLELAATGLYCPAFSSHPLKNLGFPRLGALTYPLIFRDLVKVQVQIQTMHVLYLLWKDKYGNVNFRSWLFFLLLLASSSSSLSSLFYVLQCSKNIPLTECTPL